MAQPSRIYPVDLPEETTRDRADASVVAELRVLWVIEAVRTARISTGRAARVLGMSLARFLREASAHGLPVLEQVRTFCVAPEPEVRLQMELLPHAFRGGA